ncbi:dual specificity calcium/calmodulin-dependent 3',5'-cyclic nucleotide phosphodiesterase 1-like [Daphnia carinata]|uniref:dual specificity calcium/calmodulin-dependent 3',5'-cyclic nucleotide phosphodiesterase 1-like n=1 Tax=Daphnia carinata TaxID=120202 RepID=UPI00257B8666|nr:dual specificity calcium/calmodulin-dependent 3',5'-cyclic nucleotide phosphodiesterase 1-like [Daphnia carinata]
MEDGRPLICVDNFKMEKRRHHQSLTTVDVESAVLRRCQSPRYGRSFSRSTISLNETSESTPTLSSSFGENSKEFHLVGVSPDDWETPVTGKRRESAPDFNSSDSNDSRPKIVIRLTSVEGLELNLTNSVQDNQLLPEATKVVVCPHRSIRVGATRPQPPNSVASGPKGASKDDSTFDYTPTANGEYTGSETLTIMRRSSSKRKSQRSGTGAGTPTVSELDDSALERHVGIIEDEPPIEMAAAAVPSSEVCENASLRLKCLLRLLDKGEVRPEVVQKNLKLAIQVLDSVYVDEAGSPDCEDDVGDEEALWPDTNDTSSPAPLTNNTPPHLLLPRLANPCRSRASRVGLRPAVTSLTTCSSPTRSCSSTATTPTASTTATTTATSSKTSVRRPTLFKKRRSPDDDDDLSEVRADAVPPEVRAWLASTFTRQISSHRKPGEEKPKFRSVAQAIRAGILVERIYRRMSSSSFLQFPAEVARNLKLIDEWNFDVFALSDASAGSPLRYLGIDLLNRYGVIHKFKIPSSTLEAFLNQTEAGYCKHRNLYHNNTHAADVAQTLHYVLYQTGLMNWLTDLEIFAAILAAIIHDFEHTGTTNSFHVMSGSETALLYNDRAVQENHHISAAFRLMREEDCNILINLSREEFREFRSLVIDMVLATDMSCHFQQIKAAKALLTVPELSVDKSKILSLVLHCCDVAHPSKPWPLHRHWTDLLLEEFFRQGDNEKELGLPYSPLCDRNNTLVAESQIGFIEFIVEPTMAVMGDLLDKILIPIRPQSAPIRNDHRDSISEEKCDAGGEVVTVPTTPEKNKKDGTNSKISGEKIIRPWDLYLEENKGKWKELSVKDQQRRQEEAKLKAED